MYLIVFGKEAVSTAAAEFALDHAKLIARIGSKNDPGYYTEVLR